MIVRQLIRTLVSTLTLSMLMQISVLPASAGQDASSKKAPATAGPATPAERHALIEALLAKWGPYVQTHFGADVDIWRDRLTLRFMSADATNLRDAVQQDSYEATMATLNGRGHLLNGGGTANRVSAVESTGDASGAAARFGDLNQDLVFTPLSPCRIIDTRSTGAGVIAANTTRSFVAVNASNFTSQGGSATNCGTLGLAVTAVAVNLTAVSPSGGGYATVYPFGTTQPLAASVNYASGDVVNNALIVQIPNPLSSFDFTVYTLASSHYVADIVGYFAPPNATALQCQDTANTSVTGIAVNGTANALAPACPTGYTQTATNCETSSWLMPIVFSHGGTCSARNNDSSPQDLRASRTCCRVPGR